MKTIFFILSLIIGVQWSLVGQARAFRDFIVAANSSTNPELLATDFKAFGGKARFFVDGWTGGGVTSTKGEFISDHYKFNYDFQSNDLYIKHNSDQQVIVLLNSTIRNFFLVDTKNDTIRFVKYIGVDATNRQFYQLLGGNLSGNAALLKFKTVETVKADRNSYVNNFNGTYQDTYKQEVKYFFVTKADGPIPIDKLVRKSFTDKFPELKVKANELVRKPNLNEEQAAQLVEFLNSN